MNTPIYSFIKEYAESDVVRFHMPGHKGRGPLECERLDITEICAADELYLPSGIIKESEENCASIFETAMTSYSAEGSSLCIKAMIYTAFVNRREGTSNVIAAVRNVHKSFIHACALLGVEIAWIYPEESEGAYSFSASPEDIKSVVSENKPFAVYLTSPDYLGQMTAIDDVAELLKGSGAFLLVDNAHGAYLKFTGEHPIDLGADMCCDSAHKTLPVLTGGAYLHLRKGIGEECKAAVKPAMSMFGSSSPSYLILASLDLCNRYMSEGFAEKLADTVSRVDQVKENLCRNGYDVLDGEKLKVVIRCDGLKAQEHLRKHRIECEYADSTHLVLMASASNDVRDFEKLESAFDGIQFPAKSKKLILSKAKMVMSPRDAMLSARETVQTENAFNRVCASPAVTCPPCVPVVTCGELISKTKIKELLFYGIDKVEVVK